MDHADLAVVREPQTRSQPYRTEERWIVAIKSFDDAKKAQSANGIGCNAVERMSLAELLYQVLTGEGSPFRIASGPKAA